MHKVITILFIGTTIFTLSCGKKEMTIYPASSSLIQWHGRTGQDQDGNIQLISSASNLKIRFAGIECKIWIKNEVPGNEYNYISIILDGVHQARRPIRGDTFTALEIKSAGSAQFHDLELYKETEAICGLVVIRSIEADSLLLIPMVNQKKIEFIGNSITVGMAADPSLVPCGTAAWYDQHNAYEAYGPRTARALNLEYIITGVSGIGIYRNWNTEEPTMGHLYSMKYMHANTSGIQWNIKQFEPDIVCINLGTNDLSEGDGITSRPPFDSTRFINAYVTFLQRIHNYYPDARIVLLNSPVVDESNQRELSNCLSAVKHKADTSIPGLFPVSMFSFQPFIGGGCTGHPGLEDHARMADELAPFIMQMLTVREM